MPIGVKMLDKKALNGKDERITSIYPISIIAIKKQHKQNQSINLIFLGVSLEYDYQKSLQIFDNVSMDELSDEISLGISDMI